MEEKYKQGLVLAQLTPEPLAAQLMIYLGFMYHWILDTTLAGIPFVPPSFIGVVLMGITCKMYGGLNIIPFIHTGLVTEIFAWQNINF